MEQIFVDTSAWSALADEGDIHHEEAILFRDEIAEKYHLVVTDYILDEIYTLMLMNQGYSETIRFKQQLDILITEGIIKVVWVTPEIAGEAWKIFEQFNKDKEWSFTDCVSFAVMKQLNIAEAFTLDHHFAQMGFIKQPR
ncbi:MAG: type II toxin-antitoxin system VapC family toxin [Chloroflexi bacterium]|nr:type II toxin-antitoxin system VapC family toxin [Chloroflexota bacterium]MBI5715023.1 type II toxin-antitoxin system VapC family toxin [Chloroflexota bacterium]